MKKCVISSYYSGDVYYDSSVNDENVRQQVFDAILLLHLPVIIDFVDYEPKEFV